MSQSDNAKVPVANIYDQLCDDIRKTDEVSFKLLGLVPLLSGTGLITILIAKEKVTIEPSLIVLISLFAAAITLGLFRWELRNIQSCSWMLSKVKWFQKEVLSKISPSEGFFDRPALPQRIGKTEAEKTIYFVTITTWISLPVILLSKTQLLPYLYWPYIPLALIIGIFSVTSLFAKVRI